MLPVHIPLDYVPLQDVFVDPESLQLQTPLHRLYTSIHLNKIIRPSVRARRKDLRGAIIIERTFPPFSGFLQNENWTIFR